jgi:pyruvate dehydrogenase E1 component alpha subunit
MRRFEESVAAGVVSGEIHGEMHVGLGQEAIAAGIEPLLTPADAVVSTHRPHLHALAHGVPPIPMLAELFERDGMCRGKGGHMHLFDSTRPFMCTGIVGAGAPIALGYAFAFRLRGEDSVAVALLGDGAVNCGALAESLNLAACGLASSRSGISRGNWRPEPPEPLRMCLRGWLRHVPTPYRRP